MFLACCAGLAEGARIFLWLIGNLSDARAEVAWAVAAFLGLGLACALPLARALNLLALGEEPAAQLGVPVEAVRRLLLVATSLMVGAAVSVSGLIGFVGLIIPHLLRLAVGPDHRLLVPAAALGGARLPRGVRHRGAQRCSRAASCRSARSPRSSAGRSSCCCCAARRGGVAA